MTISTHDLRPHAMRLAPLGALALALALAGCDGGSDVDAGPRLDTGVLPDVDAGIGPGVDAGDAVDAGSGAVDAGADAASPPVTGDPSAAGPLTVTVQTDSVARGSRTTPVAAHVPSGAGPFPLVIFSPGFMLDSDRYAPLCDHVASHGFVVVRADPAASAFSADHVAMRDDLGAVLDWALGAGLPIDPARVGAMGHSLGGKVTTMLAGEDARVRALLGIDPVNGGQPSFTGGTTYTAQLPDIVPEVTATLTIPVGYLGETTNGSGGFGGMACAPTDQNFQTFYEGSTAAPWAAEWDVAGADHMDFVDDTSGCGFTCTACTAGTADPAAVRAATRTVATAFFLRHLAAAPLDAYLTGASVPSGLTTRSR